MAVRTYVQRMEEQVLGAHVARLISGSLLHLTGPAPSRDWCRERVGLKTELGTGLVSHCLWRYH